jgi:hypothetical protein
MVDPIRQRWADRWLRCLPVVTHGIKTAYQEYIEQKSSREEFLIRCDEALERLKKSGENERNSEGASTQA